MTNNNAQTTRMNESQLRAVIREAISEVLSNRFNTN